MDIICTNCGEPWSIDFIHNEAEDGDFKVVNGSLIRRCPACKGHDPKSESLESKMRRDAMYAAAELCGDDVDGAAALMEDFTWGM